MVDLEPLRLVGQGDPDSAIIEEVETIVRGYGVNGISRHACRGMVGQIQLTKTPDDRGDGGAERGMNGC